MKRTIVLTCNFELSPKGSLFFFATNKAIKLKSKRDKSEHIKNHYIDYSCICKYIQTKIVFFFTTSFNILVKGQCISIGLKFATSYYKFVLILTGIVPAVKYRH